MERLNIFRLREKNPIVVMFELNVQEEMSMTLIKNNEDGFWISYGVSYESIVETKEKNVIDEGKEKFVRGISSYKIKRGILPMKRS